ncbi:MAG: hypothetical protein B6U78_02350 [Candidatus Aenigmarchaeota archaeon ex4484_224]|nr:MAG: hypothetical protein B6U78_02350 [Candidatus Aenigmarchaeota archaeon ex4484_224]
MIEFLICLIGSILGTLLGLIPGSHINNILPFLLSFSFFLNPLQLSLFIISISTSQIISSYIPSIFLGAPNEENALSILPGHKLLLKGNGISAIKIMITSSLLSTLFSFLLIAIFFNFFNFFYQISRNFVSILILLTILIMILIERKIKRILLSSFIFLISGIFGILALNFPLVNQNYILFPVLSGLFGISTLINSLNEKPKIPKQNFNIKIDFNKKLIKSSFIGSIFGILVGFLPAIGVSQAAIISQQILRIKDELNFLASLSSINVANEIFSLFAIYLINNPRSGASIAIQRILTNISLYHLFLFSSSILISLSISSLLSIKIAKRFVRIIEKIDYFKLNLIVLSYLLTSIFIFTGIYGLFLALISSSIGILAYKLGIKRSDCMGVLLIPSLLFFLKLNPIVYQILGI